MPDSHGTTDLSPSWDQEVLCVTKGIQEVSHNLWEQALGTHSSPCDVSVFNCCLLQRRDVGHSLTLEDLFHSPDFILMFFYFGFLCAGGTATKACQILGRWQLSLLACWCLRILFTWAKIPWKHSQIQKYAFLACVTPWESGDQARILTSRTGKVQK